MWIKGEIAKQEMPAVLSAATVATSIFTPNPVMWSNSANKFFDALASGKPVLINYQGWQADVLRESGAGLVLEADNVEQAAAQLVEAVHDPVWLAQAGQAAKRLAEERFARDRLVESLETVLQNAATR